MPPLGRVGYERRFLESDVTRRESDRRDVRPARKEGPCGSVPEAGGLSRSDRGQGAGHRGWLDDRLVAGRSERSHLIAQGGQRVVGGHWVCKPFSYRELYMVKRPRK